ncbi:hypothetical protein [Microbispora sp. CA-102843]|uniref:hypothetical protein n=1 Tax=Microbispora sp. CA-102843 TaxID=3239952 RepID=UPI003D8C23E9
MGGPPARPERARAEWERPRAVGPDKVYKLGDPDAAPLAKLVIGVPCAICVHDGNLWVTSSMVSGVKERRDDGVAFGDIAPRYDLHLYRDGKEIPNAPVEPFATLPRYPLPKEEGTYRLTARNDLQEVEWTFTAPGIPPIAPRRARSV